GVRCPVQSREPDMRRREFITLFGGAAVWPAVAVAQHDNKKRLVGLIAAFNDKEMIPLVAAFRARMQELGWIEGQNIVLDVRATSGDYAKLDAENGSFDLEPVHEVAERLRYIARREGKPVGNIVEHDAFHYDHQMPGGMVSNLKSQLAPLGIAHRLPEVLEEAACACAASWAIRSLSAPLRSSS